MSFWHFSFSSSFISASKKDLSIAGIFYRTDYIEYIKYTEYYENTWNL